MRQGGSKQLRYINRSRRLTSQSDVRRVAAEVRDIFPDPLQGRDLIQQRVVAGCVMRRLSAQFWRREKPEDAESIFDAYENHASLVDGRIHCPAARSAAVGSAMNPDKYRQPL